MYRDSSYSNIYRYIRRHILSSGRETAVLEELCDILYDGFSVICRDEDYRRSEKRKIKIERQFYAFPEAGMRQKAGAGNLMGAGRTVHLV